LKACPGWKTLPKKFYYLAVSRADLKMMMTEKGRRFATPKELVEGYLWHAPQDPLARCACQSQAAVRRHHNPVQILWPAAMNYGFTLCQPSHGESGAIVFGHNEQFHYHYTDDTRNTIVHGDPPPLSEDVIEDAPEAGFLEQNIPIETTEGNAAQSAVVTNEDTPQESHSEGNAPLGAREENVPPLGMEASVNGTAALYSSRSSEPPRSDQDNIRKAETKPARRRRRDIILHPIQQARRFFTRRPSR
jgi:hypothetical protein